MRHDRLDVAETLIRVKSIAEYIIKYYIQSIKFNFGRKWEAKIKCENASFVYKYKLHLQKRIKKKI